MNFGDKKVCMFMAYLSQNDVHVSFRVNVSPLQIFFLLFWALVRRFKRYYIINCNFWENQTPVFSPISILTQYDKTGICDKKEV